jgi:spore germination protein YaaH
VRSLQHLGRWVLVLLALGLIVTLSYFLFLKYYWEQQLQQKLLSGLSGFSYLQIFSTPQNSKQTEIFGFLPYWTMRQAEIPTNVTDVAYFAVMFDGQGRLVERQNDTVEMGYSRLQSEEFSQWLEEQHQDNRRVHITIVGASSDDIVQLATTPSSRERFIENMTQLLVSYPFDGLQLDLEYAGVASPAVQAGYVELVKDLQVELKKLNSNVSLSIAVFGTAASKEVDFWDIPALATHIDRLIIMSYDYHVRSSQVAGPVAPLFGKETGRYEDDITSNIRDFLLYVPAEKILLGVPFYGYEWQVTTGEPGASTFPNSGATATYKRVQELLQNEDIKVEEGWDSAALSPFVVYSQSGEKKIIYYDNPRSLSYKLDLVQQLGLRGVAIWALGYEGDQNELWEVIKNKLFQDESVSSASSLSP